MNKENHADQLSDIVTQYFMKQRISLPESGDAAAQEAYVHKLTLLHKLMVYSMKCKQTTDLDHVTHLREALTAFRTAYFGKDAGSSQGHSHGESAGHSHTH